MAYCYFNGKIVDMRKASVRPNDLGLLRGYGVFEYLRTYNGKLFLLEEHLARFQNSAKLLNLKIPIGEKELVRVIKRLIAKNKLAETGIKLVLTGGPTHDGITYSHCSNTFYILAEPPPFYPKTLYEKGAKLITCEYHRELPLIKTTNYIAFLRMQKKRKKEKVVEVLYVKDGLISECSRSNFFIFKGNTLITPTGDVLPGATRGFIIRLAKKAKFKVVERPLRFNELKQASEAFLTSTDREIMPVVKVDKLTIASGQVGENTKQLMQLFKNLF